MSTERGLRFYMNWMAFDSFPRDSAVRCATFEENLDGLSAAGFQGIQFAEPAASAALASCRARGMGVAASGRVNEPSEAAALAERLAGDGYECATLHVGWGLEDDHQADALLESVLRASVRWRVPFYIETHRATVCQDMWRTVQLVKRFPEMQFNGDFSHWYAGQEMVYGGFAKKLSFIQPVLDRVGFLHGRIANPGCIQVAIDSAEANGADYVDHFRQMWTASMRAFLSRHDAPPFLCFTPELLAPDIYYARTFGGVEESDRWKQSLLLNEIARQCFTCAQSY